MAAVASRPRGTSRATRESRQRVLLDKIKATALEMGMAEDPSSGTKDGFGYSKEIFLFGEDRRLYVSPLRATETIHVSVGDGGGGELRYDSDARKWQALFGGVPVLRDVENELVQLLTLLMGS